MRTRTTLLLLGVLLALAALALLARRPGGGERGTEPQRVFPGLETSAVRAVRVARAQGEVALERGDGGWRIVPAGHPADAAAVERLLDGLAGLEGGTVVSTNVANRATYELDEGRRIDVRIEGAEGVSLAVFAVGKSGPDFASSHIAREGDERVLLVPLELRVLLGRDADGWRDRRAVGLAREEITGVRIEGGGGAVRLERDADGAWRVDGDPADADAVGRYLDELAVLRVAAFEGPAAGDAAGFGDPFATVTVEAGGRSVSLVVGALREGEGRRFARSSRFAEPLLVPAYAAEALRRGAADFAAAEPQAERQER